MFRAEFWSFSVSFGNCPAKKVRKLKKKKAKQRELVWGELVKAK
jgi:hypothetical protein